MKRLLLVGFAAVSTVHWGTVGPVWASLITFSFTGTVTQFNADPDDPFGGAIGFETAITGSYTFESTTPDSAAAVLPEPGDFERRNSMNRTFHRFLG